MLTKTVFYRKTNLHTDVGEPHIGRYGETGGNGINHLDLSAALDNVAHNILTDELPSNISYPQQHLARTTRSSVHEISK